MKYLVALSIVIAACAANVIKDPSVGYKAEERYFYFPGDGDDTMHLVDTLEPVDKDYVRMYLRNPDNNNYWLYTRSNADTAQVLQLNNAGSVRNSNFDPSKETVFLAHGWNGHGLNQMNIILRRAFLNVGDVNVIVLDWNELANRGYGTAVDGVPGVGRGLGDFINWLVSLGADYNKVHLVGFSLGGHLVGNAGRQTGGRVRRVTALDPAGPSWGSHNERLAATDAQYVEVMHTNTALYGYSNPLGHADFYPNGGTGMPGCLTNSCSHSKSYEYMAATVSYNHLLANQCETLTEASRGTCTGNLFPMGNSDLNKRIAGIFRVNTARSYPF